MGPPNRSQRLGVALGLNLALVGGEVVGGILAHSSALLADAGHNVADVAALLLALVALRVSGRRPTSLRSYGYQRATILAALANVGILLVVTALVAAQAIWRLLHVTTVHSGTVIVVAAAAIAINGLGAALLIGERDLNWRALLLHLAGDALASGGVLVVGLIELATGGWYVLDPVVSLLIGCWISVQAVRLGRQSADVLLESTPPGIDVGELASTMLAVPGVDGVHHLHCWSLSGDVVVLSAHVLLSGHPTLEEAQVVGEAVKGALSRRYGIAHATLELECEPCAEGGATICTVEMDESA